MADFSILQKTEKFPKRVLLKKMVVMRYLKQ